MVIIDHWSIRRQSKICSVRVVKDLQIQSVGRSVVNFVGFFKSSKSRRIKSAVIKISCRHLWFAKLNVRTHAWTLKVDLIFDPRGYWPHRVAKFWFENFDKGTWKNSNGTQCGLSKQNLVANNDSKKCFPIKSFYRHFSDLSE